jgi:VWFA-related protein
MKVRGASCFAPVILLLLYPVAVRAQQTTPGAPAAQAPPRTAREAPVTFKAETNLVLVPVVVRDAKGNAVGGLGKEDFRLFQDGRSQVIASFALEETSGRTVEDRSVGGGSKAAPMVMPEHFAALMFDDANFPFGRHEDIVYSRNAALKYLDTMQPADRVALFTSSGQFDVDFTTDRAKIRDALIKLTTGPGPFIGMTPQEVARAVIGQCDKIVGRMSILPGQRTLIFVSSGLPITGSDPLFWTAVPETMRLIDHAIRSRVVMDGLDTRGLAADGADRQGRAIGTPTSRAWEFQLRVSDGTGGKFVRDTNDLEGAVRQLAATPKFIYVLGFSPDTAVAKSGFHKLEVKLRDGRKLDVEARAGYYDAGAPQVAEKSKGPAPAAKREALHYSEAESKEVAQALDIRPAAPAVESPKAPLAATTPTAPLKNDEIITTDRPVTFRVQTNLVEVPVVVRDRAGHAVGNLKQEDFRILDKGKQQEIAKFALVKAAGSAVFRVDPPTPGAQAAGVSTNPSAGPAASPAVPTRFVAFVFDDVHMRFEDLPQVRAAVLKYVGTSLGPRDRVALFTTSGQQGVDFTDRPEALSEALKKVAPSPISAPGFRSQGDAYVSYFQAVQVDQQVGLQPSAEDIPKSLALRVAVQEFGDLHTAGMAIRDAYTSGLQESRATLATLRIVVQRMAATPGQRSVLLVSPGFFVPSDLRKESDQLMALAIHSKVLISAVDARGVWTNPAFSASKGGASAASIRDEVAFRDLEGQANTDELIALAEDTGGAVNLNNDFLGGVEKGAAVPEYMYVLGFVPQNLKLDGSFHALKVTAGSGEKLSLQARRGYWAPKHPEDEAAVSKQEIENAVFSRDEIHNLPVDMHTQLTKSGEQAKLNVLTSVDLKSIHLRKAEDRNRNDLRIVATLFDTNGNFLVGTEKLVQLRLRDETVARLDQKPPVVILTDFDVKPGAYLVRLVVRDAEGQQITAENAAVEVP